MLGKLSMMFIDQGPVVEHFIRIEDKSPRILEKSQNALKLAMVD